MNIIKKILKEIKDVSREKKFSAYEANALYTFGDMDSDEKRYKNLLNDVHERIRTRALSKSYALIEMPDGMSKFEADLVGELKGLGYEVTSPVIDKDLHILYVSWKKAKKD